MDWDHLEASVWIPFIHYQNIFKCKHQQDNENLQIRAKEARIEKQYHFTPAITDQDYGPEVISQSRRTAAYLQW